MSICYNVEEVSTMIKLDNVYEAKRVLDGVAVITPLIDHSALLPFQLFNKLENMQLTGSFKIRPS